MASKFCIAKTWSEGIDDDRGFLGGGLFCDFFYGEVQKEFGDQVTEDVLDKKMNIDNVVDECRIGTHRADMSAVSRLFSVSIELAVFLSGNFV